MTEHEVTEDAARSSRALGPKGVDVASVVVFVTLWIALAARVAGAASGPQLLASLALALPAGYLAADLTSGLVHWFADTFFEERTPLIGPLLIEPFRDHHRNPEDITHHGFFEINGNNCLVAIPLLAALWLWSEADGSAAIFGVALALCTTAAVVATNQIHCWAHSRQAELPHAVVWLQRHGLILSAEHHARHHEGANDRSYCVTCGWLNPLLDRFRLFARLTHWIRQRSRRPGAHV